MTAAHAATVTWDANGSTSGQTDGAGAWKASNQWWTGSANQTWVSASDAVFGLGGTGGAVTLASATTVNSLTFNTFSGTYTLGTAGSTITLSTGIVMNAGAGAVTVISPLTLGGAQSWTNNSANTLTVSAATAAAANTLTLNGTGAGLTTLTGGLSFSGAGGLVIGKSGTLGTTLSGGTITLGGTGGITINSGASAVSLGAATLSANQNWANNSSTAMTTAGILTLTNQLSLTAGTIAFGNFANTGAGGVVINGATAQVGNAAAFGTGTLALTSGKVSSDSATARSLGNGLSINGSVTMGDATNNGALTFTGATQSITGSNTITLAGGNVSFTTGAMSLAAGSNTTFSSAGSTLTMSGGFNTNSGTDTLTINTAANAVTLSGPLSGTGTLVLAGSGTSVTLGALTGSANGVQINSTTGGVYTSSGASTFTGGTTLTSGTLIVNNTGVAGTSGALGNGGTFAINGGTINTVAAGVINANVNPISIGNSFAFGGTGNLNLGTGAITNAGDRTITLNGTSKTLTLGGIMTNSEGSLQTTTVNGAGNTLALGGYALSNSATNYTNVINGTGNVTISGVVSNGGTSTASGLTYSGSGTLTLNGTNTFAGNTLVSAGTLALGNNLALQNSAIDTSGAGVITLSGFTTPTFGGLAGSKNLASVITTGYGSVTGITLNPGTGVTNTYSGIIANGAMNLTKTGAGIQVLSGANTYTGATTISAGTLSAGNIVVSGGNSNLGNAASAIVLGDTSNQGTLSYTGGAATYTRGFTVNAGGGQLANAGTGLLTVSAGGIAAGGLFTVGGTTQDISISSVISSTGGLTKTGADTLTVSGANTYTGATTISAGTLSAGNIVVSGGNSNLGNAASAVVLGDTSNQGTLSYTGGAATYTRGFTVNAGGGQLANAGTGLLTVATGGIAAGGLFTVGGTTQGITISSVISGTGGLTKTGADTLTLSGANTYTGATTVSAGTLSAGNLVVSGGNSNLGNAASAVVLGDASNQGTLSYTGAAATYTRGFTINAGGGRLNNAGTGLLTVSTGGIAAGGLFTVGDATVTSQDISISSVISSTGGLTKAGAAILTLTGNNSYTGATMINRGSVVLNGANGAIASSTGITIGSLGTLQLDNTSNNNGNRIGSVAVTMNGGNFDFIHGNANSTSYLETAGQLSINSGASTVSTDVNTGTGTASSILTFASLARTAGATVNFGGGTGNPSAADNNNNVRFTTAPTPVNGIIGTWATVGGTNWATYTTGANPSVGALTTYDQTVTRLSSGTKSIANTAANNVVITDGTGTAANITLAASTTTIDTLTNSATGTTSPAGGVTVDPAGQILRAGGILNASGASALTIGSGTNNGTLAAATAGGELVLQNFSAANALTVNSVIANNTSASSLTVSGTGTTALTAANSFTGATTVSGGTLQIGNATTTGSLSTSSAIAVNGNGILAFNRTNTVTQGTDFASVISGTGGVTQVGSGTLVLNGTNTYSGVTTFAAGIVNVANMTNYGVAGSFGNRALSDEAITDVGLHFAGGTLQYTGSTAQYTDRSIRIGNAGGTIDASGSVTTATMNFTQATANPDPWENPGSRTLTLTGSNTGNNTFGINLQEYYDGTSHTSLVKSGAGTWDLTNSHNSDAQTNLYSTFGGYGGGTTVSGGTLGFVNGAIGGGVVDITGNAALRWDSGNTQDITTGTGAGVARSVRIEDGVTATFNTNGNNVTLSNAFAVGTLKTGAVTKAGDGTLTLSATNTYAGATTVSGGKLTISSTGTINSTSGVSIGSGEFNYNSATALSKGVSFSGTGGTLSGIGTITPAVTVTSGNTYTPGEVGAPGTQALSGGITFNSGSIFSWDLNAAATDPGANTANSGTYDKVTGNGSGTGIFNVVLGSNHFTDAFWDTNKTWTDIFSGADPSFTSWSGTDGISAVVNGSGAFAGDGVVSGQGYFKYSGSTLSWTAAPESTSALAGLLLAVGLLRRRRN